MISSLFLWLLETKLQYVDTHFNPKHANLQVFAYNTCDMLCNYHMLHCMHLKTCAEMQHNLEGFFSRELIVTSATHTNSMIHKSHQMHLCTSLINEVMKCIP